MDRFEAVTGIRYADWYGVHWARWNDAVREAGCEPNQMNRALDKYGLLQQYAEFASELGRLPVEGDLKMKRRRDPSFPDHKTFLKRLGTRSERVSQLAEHCRSLDVFENVVAWCEAELRSSESMVQQSAANKGDLIGYVYLLKHGSRREFKIGRTNNALRREGEIAIELPEKAQPVHVITTDDPAGIEAYWHNRFAAKRKNGEWFELTAADVAAFKRRRFM